MTQALHQLRAVGFLDGQGLAPAAHPVIDLSLLLRTRLPYRLAFMLIGGVLYGCLERTIDLVSVLEGK